MENYRKLAHCTYDIKIHIVWITKYRKPAIAGQIAVRTRELIRVVCQTNEVEILADTSRKLQMEYKEPDKQFWGQHLWARGLSDSSGNVTDEIIQEYIHNQDIEERTKSDNFDIGQL